MSENKSDTLSQRKKAQKDFIELKKMQAGEIEVGTEAKEEIPLTFKEKLKNFWYHYKVHTILALFAGVAIAICVSQCATRPDYDAHVLLYTRNYFTANQIEVLTDYMKQYFTDTNGDGEVNIVISDCSYTTDSTFDSNQTSTYASKLNATMASGYETQLYILDQKTLKQLDEVAAAYGGFLIESAELPAKVAELQDDQGYKFPEGMIIGRRVLKGTAMENNETAVTASDNAAAVLERIREVK